MENEGGARLVTESSQASDLASLNLTGSKGLESYSHNNDRQGYATTSEREPKDGFRDEWRHLEVSYSEIRDITDNFSELLVIGKGGFGKVYQAKLDGRTVAIKILDSTSKQGQREFFQEIDVLFKLQHPNLVKLVRACFKEVRALAYEYLPNGSLEDCLMDSPETLTWQLRTRIIYEICLALSYLHSKSVIHADLKPANVLLDANFKSKLSDFGLCRFLPEDMVTGRFLETSPMGTPGYTDPWFLDRCILRPGSDLYSLGITVLKLLTGMSPIGLSWKISQTNKDSLPKMIDPTAGNWPSVMAEEMVYWSLQCCYHNENSSEVLMNMSTGLLGMLDEIETLRGGTFKPRQSIQDGSGILEPPPRKEDKNEVMGTTNPSSSSYFSEPRQTIQDGSGGLEPPSRNEDKNEVMGATNPSSSSSLSEPRQTIQDGSGGLEPPSLKEDKNEVMGATNPSLSSSFSEAMSSTTTQGWKRTTPPEQTVWQSLVSLFLPKPRTQDGLSAPEPSSSNIDTQPQPPIRDGLSAPKPSASIIDTRVEERGGEKLVRFDDGSKNVVFGLDDEFSSPATPREYVWGNHCWKMYVLTLKDGNRVSLKTIKDEFAKGRTEFEEEAKSLEKIRHPNLLAVRGYYLGAKGILKKSLVFEFFPKGSLCNQGSLCTRLHYGGGTKIDWATRMNIAVGIARGLDYIHNDMKVIHGHLTSDNIHLDDNDNAKILDYELSRFIRAPTRDSEPIRSNGSLAYCAPELSSWPENANTKTDVYSLGVVLLELLTRNNQVPPRRGGLEKSAASAMKAEKPCSVLAKDLVSDALGVTNEQVAALLLALDCVKFLPGERPEVKQVMNKLEEIKLDVDAGGTSYSAPSRED